MGDYASHAVALTRLPGGPLEVRPDTLTISPASFGVDARSLPPGLLRLSPPAGWHVSAAAEGKWTVKPYAIRLDHPATFRLEIIEGTRTRDLQLTVAIRLDLYSTFNPRIDPLPLRNSAADIGEVIPQRKLLSPTYVFPRSFASSILFNGLYSDIVYLSERGPSRGGLCSGLARWAIARCLSGSSDPVPTDQALDEITILHGRQLTDRALLAGLPWFLRGSPIAAYRAVRDDLLYRGATDRALDVGVPKLWRRDLFSALVRQGHTVVPYRLIQNTPESATLEVYDPNRPPSHPSSPQQLQFQFRQNRYQLRKLVTFDDGGVGIVAVRQPSYDQRGTAVLATFASGALLLGRLASRFWKRRIPGILPRDSSS